MRIDTATETTALATKITAAVLGTLTEEDKKNPMLDEALWLAVQMLSGPADATHLVRRCQGDGR